ncbi:MAG: hypothetical protein C0412_17555 [Flavobacterium sp.]|nr:hypothetical protein [Flavobacterium sp.]
MKKRKFEVKIYYSSFCNHNVEAQNEVEALQKARKLKIDKDEIAANLESWNDADTIEEIKKKG